jgi:group I intron endonuclease
MEDKIEQQDKFVVYKHTNKINGKVYIGITYRKDPKKRWSSGWGYTYKRSCYFSNAIKKYGWKNFNHEILFTGLTKEEAHNKEIELIAYYRQLLGVKNVYNQKDGGQGGGKASEELKNKMREARSKLDRKLINKKISESRKTKVINIETKEIFESGQQAAEKYGIAPTDIAGCCIGRIRTAQNFHWMHLEDYQEATEDELTDYLMNCWNRELGKQIICINTQKVFSTFTEASKYYNISPYDILECCRGNVKLLHNLRWMFLDDYNNLNNEEKKKLCKVVICTTTKEIFNTASDASKYYNLSKTLVQECCKGKYKYAGRNPENKDRLEWIFLEDFKQRYPNISLSDYKPIRVK